MLLTLIRHGETEHNRDRLTLGRADVPLTARGRLQSRALAASFTRAPAAIRASPLARCRETAAVLAAATGLTVTIDPALVEMDVGEMEHLTQDDLRARYPGFLQRWMTDPADVRMPGGETLREVQDRAWSAIERIRDAQAVEAAGAAPGEREVVVVTHNFVIRAVACRALGLALNDFRRLQVSVASKTIIDMGPSGLALIYWNDTSHLRSAGLG
jgi:broad specificity phosphatase PhoE